MSESRANIPKHGGIRLISLQPRNRKFSSKKFKHSIRNSQIPFAVFKFKRIYFVGHGRRAHIPYWPLAYPVAADVSPYILVKTNKNSIDPSQIIKNFYIRIVGLNLSSEQVGF